MACARNGVIWLGLAMAVLWTGSTRAQATDPANGAQAGMRSPSAPICTRRPAPAGPAVPVEELPPPVRDKIRKVMEQPTLVSQGLAEEFAGQPNTYYWLLDHPDKGSRAWRRLGAEVMDIEDRGNGRFGWCNGQGCDISWETVYHSPALRVWYAEGSGRPGPFLPSVPVRAVLVLRHLARCDAAGQTLIRHHAELFAQTDSATAALVVRLLGPAVPRLAEQCVDQLQLFFAALTWYLDQNPEQIKPLLAEETPADLPQPKEVMPQRRRITGRPFWRKEPPTAKED